MELYLDTYEDFKKVESFLFSLTFPEPFTLHILIGDTKEHFNYTTEYNDLIGGLVLVTF